MGTAAMPASDAASMPPRAETPPSVHGRDAGHAPTEDAMPSTLESSPVAISVTPEGVPYRFLVDDFYRMIEQDIFPDDRRVGLWDGQVYEKMAKERPHSVSGNKLHLALVRVLPPRWF